MHLISVLIVVKIVAQKPATTMNSPFSPTSGLRSDRAAWAGLGVTLAIHVMGIAFLLSYAPARDALTAMVPLMVELIKPELPAPPVAKPEPKIDKLPKPLPVKKVQPRPEPESRILAAEAPAAAVSEVAAVPEPKPAPPVESRPAPPAPILPPAFNADYLDNHAPAYPSISRRMGEQGRVLLRVYVEASGLPSSVEVRTSSGSERLDQAALEAVRRWKFVPAKQGDKAVPAYVVVPILFNLRS